MDRQFAVSDGTAEQRYQTKDGAIRINYIKRAGNFSMDREHTHTGCELYYLLSGERDYFIRDRTYRVEEGSFVFIENGELHRTIDTGVPDHERVVINFQESLMEGFPLKGRNGVIRLSPQNHWKGEALVQELIEEGKGDAPGRDLMMETLLKRLLLLLFRSQTERGSDMSTHSPVHQMMSEVASYISKHFHEPLQLRDVADRFFVSPYYLSRKFKQCTGFGFAEYIQLVRIREAQRLLKETDLKIIDIAEKSGIGQTASFHKLFKKLTGCSPLQYRKRSRSSNI